MSKPDWNEAPADAGFWAPDTNDFNEAWYKTDGESWFCVGVDAYRVFGTAWYGLGRRMLRDDLEARP